MKLALVIYTSFWPVFIQTTYGMRDIDSTLIDMARIHRVRRMRRLAEIVIPSIGPYFVVGLRLSVVGALIASIVTELIGGAPGLGYAAWDRTEYRANREHVRADHCYRTAWART